MRGHRGACCSWRVRGRQRRRVWAEAYVLDRCRDHPRFPQLLDVFMGPDPGQHSLVLEYAGEDLSLALRARGGKLNCSTGDYAMLKTTRTIAATATFVLKAARG